MHLNFGEHVNKGMEVTFAVESIVCGCEYKTVWESPELLPPAHLKIGGFNLANGDYFVKFAKV